MFGPETRALVEKVRKAVGQRAADRDAEKTRVPEVRVTEEKAGIHAWPVVGLFLASSMQERVKGLKTIVETMNEAMCLD